MLEHAPPREPAPAPSSPAIVLAFDVGARRIGVARGDTVSRSAAPLTCLGAQAGVPTWAEIDALLREWQPARLIVGLPYNVDDSESLQTRAAREFARELGRRHALPVELVDERYSSLEAQQRLREARRTGTRRRRVAKRDIDAAAACIILERWLGSARDG